jgi:hypothetical protein
MTLTNACPIVAASIQAASSSAHGVASKKLRISQMTSESSRIDGLSQLFGLGRLPLTRWLPTARGFARWGSSAGRKNKMAHGRGGRGSRLRRGILPIITLLALCTISLAAAATERLVLASSLPTVEINRFWASGDWSSVGQAMEMLVGAHPLTGELDNSALAESWSVSDDFRTWTFKLKEGVELHHGYGEVTAEDYWHLIEAAN